MAARQVSVGIVKSRLFSRVAAASLLPMCLLWPQVGEKSTPERAQCLCNHLTLFGSSFFVMPNHVDISRTAELFATVSDNFVVLALLCAFFGLYLVTLLWACYADRRSSSKVRLCMLNANAMLDEVQKKFGSWLKSTRVFLSCWIRKKKSVVGCELHYCWATTECTKVLCQLWKSQPKKHLEAEQTMEQIRTPEGAHLI